MSAQNRTPSLGTGLLAAVILSACGAALLATLSPWLGHGAALRAVLGLLGFAYVVYAIGQSGERAGRLTTVVCWLAAAGGISLLGLPLPAYVLAHLGAVWLVRSLYYYSGLLPALADLTLSALGAAFAVWAAQRTGSPFIALWCFFLVQAFHVSIPRSPAERTAQTGAASDDAFARAHDAAEAAVRRLTSAAR